MTLYPAPRTLAGVALCLLALLLTASAGAQEVPPPDAPVEELAPAPDLASALAADGRFTVLVGALAETGLDEALAGDGPFTVFAPTDSAFAALPEGALASLSAEDLRAVLLYHVVEGQLDPETAGLSEPVGTLGGASLDLAVLDGAFVVNGVAATETALDATNGRIYALDTVLLPPAPEAEDDLEDGF